VYRPFTSPIVLATYREYAETLTDNGIATPQATDGEGPLYYRLDLRAFSPLVDDPSKTWNSIGIQKHGISNGNGVLAHSPNICSSNSSGTYMGLVAFVQNGNQVPHDVAEAQRLANQIKPLVTAQGLPRPTCSGPTSPRTGRARHRSSWCTSTSSSPTRWSRWRRSKKLDDRRVLLYPSTNFLTQPEFIALNPDGDRWASW
jgi:hypothetical protein